jgi:hypothetical protein
MENNMVISGMARSCKRLTFILFSACLVMQWATSAPAQAPPPPIGYNDIQKEMFKKVNDRFGIYSGNVIEVNRDGIIIEIKTIYMNTGLDASDPVERVYQFFERNKDLFLIPDPRKELAVTNVVHKEDGTGVLLIDQVVGNVKVFEGGCQVAFACINAETQLTRFYSNGVMGLLPDAHNINPIPTIDSLQAVQIARADSAHVKNPGYVSYYGLWIANGYRRMLGSFADRQIHLVWRLSVKECTECFIDAHTGAILYSGSNCIQ